MAKYTSYAKQSVSAAQMASRYKTFLAEKAGAGTIGTIGNAPVVTVPTKPEDADIEAFDFPRVRPGDLITADFINDLIDTVGTIDARLQRIEKLLAAVIDRDKKTVPPPPPPPPPFEGKP